MGLTLAAFAASDAPLPERLRVALELTRAVADLHARGRVHGALCPERVVVAEDGAVVLEAASCAGEPLGRAGFDAPEVARGGRPTRRSDAFSLGALAWLALCGREPFDADEPLERVRRALFAEPGSVRLRATRVSLDVEAAIQAALEKRPRRRISAAELAEALGGMGMSTEASTSNPSPTSTATATATPTATPTATDLLRRQLPTFLSAARALSRLFLPAVVRSLSPLQGAGLVALPVLALGLFLLPESDAALEREIASLVERGDLAAARRRLDASAKERPGDPLVEKLRGDVACARGEPAECIRRYRVALASRPELREDPALRANARRLLRRDEACSTRRSAAHLLGELRDPEALADLEEARRSGGFLASLCTGDSIERAITATRAELGGREGRAELR